MTLRGWDIPVFVFDPNVQIGKNRLTSVSAGDLLNDEELPDEGDSVWLLETESGLNGPGEVNEILEIHYFDERPSSWYALIKVDWSQLILAEDCDEEDS